MKEIINLRKKLDKIDLKLLKTLSKRNNLASKIKKIKKENRIKLEDKSREKTILKTLNSKKLIPKKTLENIYKEIFKQSK